MANGEWTFDSNIGQVCAGMEQVARRFLEEAGGEVAAQAARNTRVRSGRTKASFTHKVDGDEVVIGSDYENAIWEEFGTGIYAETGGRSTPWVYRDESGKFFKTQGKRGTRALRDAFTTTAPAIRHQAERLFNNI